MTACSSDGDTSSPTEAGDGRDGEASLEAPTFDSVRAVPLSAGEHDRLLGAAFDGQNRLYGAGWLAQGTDQLMAVGRFRPDGQLDPSFGSNGVASVNVAQGGKAAELARGVVVQSAGKVVISGTVEHDPIATGDAARDTNIALARFDEKGKLDPTFGTGGVVKLDLSTGVADGTSFRGDTAWGLTGLRNDKVVVVGAQVGAGEGRRDLDFAVVRLNADGSRDPSFGTAGVALVGVAPGVSETPKTAVELADGRLVVTGYANVDGIVKIVLFRLTPQGQLDPTFGTDGLSVTQLLGSVTESYAVGLVGNRLVTTGYGRDTAEPKVDLVAGGFTETGALDTTFGSNGMVRIDVAGDDDRGRSVVALPDGGVLMVGSGKPTPTNLDAMVVKLTATGAPDTSFGLEGRRLFDIGGPNDAFFGVAVSHDRSRVAVVGYLGRDTTGSEKDDSAVLWLRP
ncbi:MAG: hypothetical protein M3314_12715 [Actinomycetota bacterium]|nr:hypothetical protein [Actinomycetota bacterium]